MDSTCLDAGRTASFSRVKFTTALCALPLLAAVCVGCTPRQLQTPQVPLSAASAKIVAIPKRAGDYARLDGGVVRIFSRGEFKLDHEDASTFYVLVLPSATSAYRVARAEPGPAAEPVVTSQPIVRKRLSAVEINAGLPRSGQWRDQFALGDVLGDGSTQAVFPPARKSGGVPVAFRLHLDAWARVDLHVPAGHYDYGGVALGDIDGNGRMDMVLGMHLTGFSALLAQPGNRFKRIDDGLPQRHAPDFAGTGHAVLVLPAGRDESAPFVLLQEVSGFDAASHHAPGLALYRWESGAFHAQPLGSGRYQGGAMAFSPAGTNCPAKLVVAQSSSQPPLVFESTDLHAFRLRKMDAMGAAYAYVGAIALGDEGKGACSSLAVAYKSRVGGQWHSKLDVYRDDGTTWQRITLLDMTRAAAISALTFVPASDKATARLLALDGDGAMRIFELDADAAQPVFQLAAPDWRQGCAASDVRLLSHDSDGSFSVIASFAGEPTMGQFDRCREGGGIDAWRFTPLPAGAIREAAR